LELKAAFEDKIPMRISEQYTPCQSLAKLKCFPEKLFLYAFSCCIFGFDETAFSKKNFQ